MEFLPRVIHTFHSYGRKETDKKNMLEKHEVVDPVNLKNQKQQKDTNLQQNMVLASSYLNLLHKLSKMF